MKRANQLLSIAVFLMLFILFINGCNLYSTEDNKKSEIIDDLVEREPVGVIADLQIGERVTDKTWVWEYKLAENYTDETYGDIIISGKTKPVIWIVVANDHYGPDSGVTLLAEELIGLYTFDSSQNDDVIGYNQWINSGKDNADYGVRTWLNSTGIYEDKGFFNALSENFRKAVMETDVPNMVWNTGTNYFTSDKVFIPSKAELGGQSENGFENSNGSIYETETVFSYFEYALQSDRIAQLDHLNTLYWTRTPDSEYPGIVHIVTVDGSFDYYYAVSGDVGVRPVININPNVKISETPDEEGVYEIQW